MGRVGEGEPFEEIVLEQYITQGGCLETIMQRKSRAVEPLGGMVLAQYFGTLFQY